MLLFSLLGAFAFHRLIKSVFVGRDDGGMVEVSTITLEGYRGGVSGLRFSALLVHAQRYAHMHVRSQLHMSELDEENDGRVSRHGGKNEN